MPESDENVAQQLVECSVCLKEVPASGAKNEEASDYVFYFCGIDCYAQWKEKARNEVDSDENK